jgi:hypothetical protein
VTLDVWVGGGAKRRGRGCRGIDQPSPAGVGVASSQVKNLELGAWSSLIAEFYLVDRGLRHWLPGFSSMGRLVILP